MLYAVNRNNFPESEKPSRGNNQNVRCCHNAGIFSLLSSRNRNYALLISAILSWVAPDAEGWLVNLIYAITEPFLLPVRKLLAKKNLNSAGPLDLSFFLTVMLILIIRACLSALIY